MSLPTQLPLGADNQPANPPVLVLMSRAQLSGNAAVGSTGQVLLAALSTTAHEHGKPLHPVSA